VTEKKHKKAARKHREATRKQKRAVREHERASRKQMNETVLSGGAKRQGLSQPVVTCWPGFGETIYIYIYILSIRFILNQ